MTALSTLPQVVDIDAPAGDTLTLYVTISAELIGSRVFTAQVRANKSAAKVDATFSVTLTATGADVVLASADSQRLTKRGPFEGYWDLQLAPAGGGDPVTTLAGGVLRLHPDVTRPVV